MASTTNRAGAVASRPRSRYRCSQSRSSSRDTPRTLRRHRRTTAPARTRRSGATPWGPARLCRADRACGRARSRGQPGKPGPEEGGDRIPRIRRKPFRRASRTTAPAPQVRAARSSPRNPPCGPRAVPKKCPLSSCQAPPSARVGRNRRFRDCQFGPARSSERSTYFRVRDLEQNPPLPAVAPMPARHGRCARRRCRSGKPGGPQPQFSVAESPDPVRVRHRTASRLGPTSTRRSIVSQGFPRSPFSPSGCVEGESA